MIAETIINEINKLLKLYNIEYLKCFLSIKNNKATLYMYMIENYKVFRLSDEFILKAQEDLNSEFKKIEEFLLGIVVPRVVSEYRLKGFVLRTYKIEQKPIGEAVNYVFVFYPSKRTCYNALFASSKNNYLEFGVRLKNYVFS